MDRDYDKLIVVNSREEISEDMTTEEAVEFWDTHALGPGLFEEGKNDPELQAFAARLRRDKSRQAR